MAASVVFAGIRKLLQTKPVKDVVKKYGKKAYDAYKKANRKIDKKLTSKPTKESIDRTKQKNLQRRQAAEFTEKAAEKKIGSLTKKGQRRVGEGAKPQIKVSTKGNPIKGRIRKIKGLGVLGTVGGAGVTAALMKDKKEPKGTTTKTKTQTQIKKEFDAKFAKERAAGKSSFMFDKKDGKGRRSFNTKRADGKKKFQAAGRGAGKTRLGMKRGGHVKRYV